MDLPALKSNISKTSLKDQVVDILMELILSGQLKSGDRIKEMHIAKHLGVSQAPVREAIRSLEAMGYIEHIPNAGARVKTFSLEKLREVYQVREALEIAAVKIAFELNDRTALAVSIPMLEDAHNKMEIAAKNNDAVDYAKNNTQFHRIILTMSGNETLMGVWESLAIQSRVLHTMFGTEFSVEEAFKLHRGILDAIKNGNYDAICRELGSHYESVREFHVGKEKKEIA